MNETDPNPKPIAPAFQTGGRGMGMGYVPPEFAKAGTIIEIETRGRRSPAVVVAKPIYKPETTRFLSGGQRRNSRFFLPLARLTMIISPTISLPQSPSVGSLRM